MKNSIAVCILVFGFFVTGSTAVYADSKSCWSGCDISVAGSMDYYSKYMFRGYTYDQDPVVQTGLCLSSRGFAVSYWANMAVANADAAVLSNEIDLSVSYTQPLGPVSVTVGHLVYNYTGIVSDTKEVFGGIALNNLPFTASVTAYSDYDAVVGNYISLDASTCLPAVGGLVPTVAAHYGIYASYGAVENGGDYSLAAKCSLPLTTVLTVTPSITYAAPTGDLADEAKGNQKSGLWGGFSLGYSF